MIPLIQFRRLLSLLDAKEKVSLTLQLVSRCLLGILDPAAILLMGLTISLLVAGPDRVPTAYRGLYSYFGVAEPEQAALRLRLILFFGIVVMSLFILKSALGLLLAWKGGLFASKLEAKYAFGWANSALKNPRVLSGEVSAERITHALTSGVSAVFQRTLTASASLVSELTVMLLMTGVLAVVQPVLVAASLGYFGIIAWLMHFWLGRKIERRARIHSHLQVETFETISNLVNNYREFSLSGWLGDVTKQFASTRLLASRALATNLYLSSLPRYVLETSLILGAFLLAILEFKSMSFSTAIPILTMFLAAASRITPSLITTLNCVAEIRSAKPDFDRTLTLVDYTASRPLMEEK